MLNEAIDRIAGWGATPVPSEAVAFDLTSDEIREAAIIHLATLLEADPERATGDDLQIGGLLVRLEVTEDPTAPIHYDDVDVRFAVVGATLVRQDGPDRLAALLRLFQYARDRSDGLLYLPHEMRAERIAALAQATGASERFVRHVLARFPALSTRAAA